MDRDARRHRGVGRKPLKGRLGLDGERLRDGGTRKVGARFGGIGAGGADSLGDNWTPVPGKRTRTGGATAADSASCRRPALGLCSASGR